MSNLLKNKEKLEEEIEEEAKFFIDEKNDLDSDEDNEAKEENLKESNKKVNLDRYKDPEGLSIKKMAIGLWFVQNRKHFIFIFMIILALISAITWIRFIYVFGSYVLFGIKYDNQLANEIITHTIVEHEFFLARTPKDIQYNKIQAVKGANDKYDFLVQATNPNQNYWAEIKSHIKVAGTELAYETNFILPGENKKILITGQDLANFSNNMKFINDETLWHRIDRHKYPDWEEFTDNRLDITTENIEFTPAPKTIITEKIPLNNLDFTVLNNSAYNYRDLNINILIYGVSDQILILDEYTLNDFMSGESRKISITIPGDYPKVGNIEVIPEINITRDDIYIKFEGDIGEIR